MKRLKGLPPLLLTPLLLSACSASHLVYVQESSLGLTLALGTEGSQKLSLGYDRDILAVVPQTGDAGNGTEDENDAMALLSINRASIAGLADISTSEFVATGLPAEQLAQNPAAIEQLRQQIYARD